MLSWIDLMVRAALGRRLGERGQAEAFVVALAIFLLILIISGRRVVVQ